VGGKIEYSRHEAEFMKCAASFPIVWKKAVDYYIWDENNKKYLDFTSGIFAINIGHSNPEVIDAIKKQLDKKLLFTFSYPTEIRKKFVDKLMSMVQPHLDKVALYCTGSETTDRAIQIARKHTGKKEVMTIEKCFHGNTCLWEDIYKSSKNKIDFPLTNDRDFDKDISYFEPESICAFILEGYQGWSAYVYPKEYVLKIEEWCRKNNILLIFDEVQSGMKRTGPLFCYENYGVKPDLVIFGKGAAGGLPLSGILGREKIMDCMNEEKFASTHSGNTLVMATALANLNEIEKIDSEEIKDKGEYFFKLLKNMKHKIIKSIVGKGLIAAVHFENKEISERVALKCLDNGLMVVNTGLTTLKIGPPLTIDKKSIKKGVDIIDKAIGEVEND